MIKVIQIKVQGRVQGVGFRYFTLNKAEEHRITGWVKNLITGEVEILAEGDPEQLNAFISLIKTGPSHSRVDNIILNDLPKDKSFHSFEIH